MKRIIAFLAALLLSVPAFGATTIPWYGIPDNATPWFVSSGSVAAAAATATFAATANNRAYISGFNCQGSGATAASVVVVTLTGLLASSGSTVMHFPYAVPAGVTIGGPMLRQQFDPALPANAINAAVTLTMPSLGAGNTQAACVMWGFMRYEY